MNADSYAEMLAEVQSFHDKHDFKNTGGEELTYRVALMAEELGEISACVSKDAIAADFDLKQAFWQKMEQLKKRKSRMIAGRIRVSDFRDT